MWSLCKCHSFLEKRTEMELTIKINTSSKKIVNLTDINVIWVEVKSK
jgi:hypothetical protein